MSINTNIKKINTNFNDSKILFVFGLTIQDLFTKDIEVAKMTPLFTYMSIPQLFTGYANWPKYTNLACWVCHRVPNGAPTFVPKNPRVVNGEDICEPVGNFDTWPCAAKYIELFYSEDMHWDTLCSLTVFANLFPGAKIKEIKAAPDHTRMKQYWGDNGITNEEYDKLLGKKIIYNEDF